MVVSRSTFSRRCFSVSKTLKVACSTSGSYLSRYLMMVCSLSLRAGSLSNAVMGNGGGHHFCITSVPFYGFIDQNSTDLLSQIQADGTLVKLLG